MNPKKSRVCSLDLARYAEAFGVFVRHSLEYDQILAAIGSVIRKLPPNYSLLDVGAGTGELIRELVASARLPPSTYVAFEPNPTHFVSLEAAVGALGLREVELHAKPFDAGVSLESRFDFVLFSHSLYWMIDPAGVFQHAVRFLKPGGTVMGILQGPYGVHTLLSLFESRFERLTPMLQNNAYSSHELLSALRGRGLEPQCMMMPTPLDVTGLFDPGGGKALSELMSFCLQLEFEDLETDLQAELIDHVRGATVPAGGRRFWYIPNAVVTVSRGI